MRFPCLQLLILLLCSCTEANPDYLPNVRRVFVTTGMYGAPSVLDRRLCTSAAAAAGLMGSWTPWISYAAVDFKSINAIDRFRDDNAWVDMNSTLLFPDWESMKRGPKNPIVTDQFGYQLPINSPIWTGTLSDGTRSENVCFDRVRLQVWTSELSTDRGEIGRTGHVDSHWTSDGFLPCSEQAHVLCFEQ